MQSTTILQYMKKHGQKLDREIAQDTGIALPQVRIAISKLQSSKAVFSCSVINYEGGLAVEGILCRISGYIPPAAPGRKTTTQGTVA